MASALIIIPDTLTATERKIYNNLSREVNPAVLLGDRIAKIVSLRVEEGTPVNAAAATGTLTLDGVVVDGEDVSIGEDIYEFVSDAAQSVTTPGNIPVDIKAYTAKASVALTMAAQPTAGDTVTLGEKTYIFVPVGTDTADGEVSIGADLAGAQAALVAAINGTDDINEPHPLVSAADFQTDVCAIIALVGGTAGNTIDSTETFTSASNLFNSDTLGAGANAGADCTAANAVTALVAAITASDTQGVGAADGTGDTVNLTADVAGEAGNDITVSTTMANGSFGEDVETLAGGSDGTVSDGIKMVVDDTYLYVSLGVNTVAGKNWRRISLGSAY